MRYRQEKALKINELLEGNDFLVGESEYQGREIEWRGGGGQRAIYF